MDVSRFFRRRFLKTLVIWVLLSSVILIPSSVLVIPARSDTQWWNTDWSFRKQIILNHTMVRANLTDFPVLIVDSNLTGAQPSGGDIVFVNEQNVKLDHEIEFYDSNAGSLVAWVRIPLLSSTADTIIYMYYGNSDASNQQDPTSVWNANFALVQHLEETSTRRYDSTVNRNDGTAIGGVSKSVSGKVDGADLFDGVNDQISVPNSLSLNPGSAISVEAWINLYSTGNYQDLVNKNRHNQYYLRLGAGEGNAYWSVKFTDGTLGIVEGNIGWKFNKWHHIVATLDTQARTIKVYLDGVETKLTGTFASGKGIISTSSSLLISGPSPRWIKGSIDEVRISNVRLSAEWIQTSYNTQMSPASFSAIGNREVGPNSAVGPIVFGNPPNGAVDIYTNPTLSAKVSDPNGRLMTVMFKEKVSNSWIYLEIYENCPDGTYYANATQMRNLGTAYYWGVDVGNGESWTNKTYVLTTTTAILSQKWTASTGVRGVTGALAADINRDGKDEVVFAGNNSVVALNGADGREIWRYTDINLGDHAQPQMMDLNKDGILEIIVSLQIPAGMLVLHSNNGSLYWRIIGGILLGGETYSSPVVFDIDGNGYPTIFMGSTDTSHGLDGTGKLTSISHDGKILNQTFIWRPCGGGLSLADADQDGEFEIFISDRYAYFKGTPWDDNDYGRGVQSYWAKNLTLRWSRPDVFCSSQKPMLADANNDGKLDVIIGDLNGGWWVLSATDGSTIKHLGADPDATPPIYAPSHYQPSVYDIDKDDHLEILSVDGSEEARTNNTEVWDLVNGTITRTPDAILTLGKSFYGPQVGDVDGDGAMEIIAANETAIFILKYIDGDYTQLAQVTGLRRTLNYGVLQDIDGDGYNELIMSSQSGYVYAFDTPGRRATLRPRTEVQGYSEYRRGAAEYVKPEGGPAPIVMSPNPQHFEANVPLSISNLEFTLVDYQHDIMNYSVATSPNIGNSTGINVSNGKYNVSVSNLSPSTTYDWNITVTDGTNRTEVTYSFTTRAVSPWLSADWKYRKTITINHAKVKDNLSNFPVLIDVTDPDFGSKVRPNGEDIIFTDVSNNQLNHEIEHFDNVDGHLIAWVNVPQLSYTSDTVLNMYYGNSTVGDQQEPTLTWDSRYVMVQHLEETSTTRKDSTTYYNNGITYGGINKSPFGIIDGADIYDGVNDYMRISNSPSLNPSSAISIEVWMNLSSTADWIDLVSKNRFSQYYLRLDGKSAGSTYWWVKFTDGTASYVSGSIGWAFNKWHHIVATLDTQARTIQVYLDGVLKLDGTFASGKKIASTTSPVLISGISSRFAMGSIDEVRISNVRLSAEWIRTSYNNQENPSAFNTEGEEETIPMGPVIYNLRPVNRARGISTSIGTINFSLTDAQSDFMNYTVTTIPDIGYGNGTNVTDGEFSINVADLHYSTTYRWSLKVTDGLRWTNNTFSFTTIPSTPPTQGKPNLTKAISTDNLICQNNATSDEDGDKVTNIYNWYRNNVSLTNLLLPFDTNSSAIAKDYSGNGNDGFIVRGATWTQNGKIGGAYNFNRGYILVPGSDTLDGGGQWSQIAVEHWIYLNGSQSNARTIARLPSYQIVLTGVDKNYVKIYASVWVDPHNATVSGLHHTPSSLITTGAWHHVVLTYKSGDRLRLYVDGNQVASSEIITGNIQRSGSNPLYIGWFDYFKGKVDEIRIYPRSLSAAQVSQRYNETKNGLTTSSTILKIETQLGEVWKCAITPNDSHIDGETKYSDSVIT